VNNDAEINTFGTNNISKNMKKLHNKLLEQNITMNLSL
jgi:hypothetical protein